MEVAKQVRDQIISKESVMLMVGQPRIDAISYSLPCMPHCYLLLKECARRFVPRHKSRGLGSVNRKELGVINYTLPDTEGEAELAPLIIIIIPHK